MSIPNQPSIPTSSLKRLLQAVAITRDEELGCENCFEHVDQYAEMLIQGQDPAQVLPLIQHHLEMCPCCHDEFDMLVDALKAIEDN